MRKPRRFITAGGGTRHFHVVSRIVNRDFVLGSDEKEFFRRTMRKLEAFSGVQILTYCVMSNHFHLLIKVPDPIELSDEELCQRMSALYSKLTVNEFRDNLLKARGNGDLAFVELLRNRITCRMHDLSMFMKDLKQRFSQWYNRRHGRRGTLWEERYRALLVEGSDHALLTIASYIDLNPVRAGICDDPTDYRFCGYSEALGGNITAREGLKTLLLRYDGALNWLQAAKEYRKHLFEVDETMPSIKNPSPKTKNLRHQKDSQPGDSVNHLNQWELLRCRIRYFTDGVVLGSRSFVNQFFIDKRIYFGPKRKSGARKIKGCRLDNLYTARDLQLNRFS
jgi:putative transposase